MRQRFLCACFFGLLFGWKCQLQTHPFTWKSYLWVRSDAYFCQCLCRFDFTNVCILRGQRDQRLHGKEENVDQVRSSEIGKTTLIKVLHIDHFTFPPPCATTVPLSSCFSTRAKKTLWWKMTLRGNPQRKQWLCDLLTSFFLPCDALPTSFGEGRTLLFDHTH